MDPERPLTDAELVALAAVANVDAAEVAAANADRAANGHAMAYNGCDSDAAVRLRQELVRRGILGDKP
jgi:hypothetical protein